MFTTESLTPNTITNRPEWVRVPEAVRLFGISRTKLYELISDGNIRTVSLRKLGQIRGTRLIQYDSMCAYLDNLADQQQPG